jgi:hypothetical protein
MFTDVLAGVLGVGSIGGSIWCKARKVWKLKQRYQRLCSMADRARDACMNLAWLEVSDHIFSTLNKLEALGVDTENMEG